MYACTEKEGSCGRCHHYHMKHNIYWNFSSEIFNATSEHACIDTMPRTKEKMTVLIINNYPGKKDLWKIDQIKGALLKLGRSDIEVRSFRGVNDQPLSENVEAIVLSGSNSHLSTPEHLAKYKSEIELVRKVNIPILGICFGHQLIGVAFGSDLYSVSGYIKDLQKVKLLQSNEIFSSWKGGDILMLCQYHKDSLSELPKDFVCLAESKTCKIEAMKHQTRPIYGIQAHIERAKNENPDGLKVLENFIENVVKRSTIVRIMKTKSLSEIKQVMVDTLRDIEYDILREDMQKVESKLRNAQMYVDAWVKKKVIDQLT